MATVGVAFNTAPAHASFGPAVYSNIRVTVNDLAGFNRTLVVCDYGDDGLHGYANFYRRGVSGMQSQSTADGLCVWGSHATSITQIRACKPSTGCSAWLYYV